MSTMLTPTLGILERQYEKVDDRHRKYCGGVMWGTPKFANIPGYILWK
ncbi:22182_t:CDS:1, partial [Dentiscutata erythropus]